MRLSFPRLDSRRNRLILATVLAAVACLVLWKTAHAGPVEDAIDWAISKLIWLIMQAIALMGSIVLWLVSLLIDAAKYNKFTTAQPVVTGWVLVRDTVNMFFIVVLLVISFSTIIGYRTGEFGVKQNLPKLLLYAVLINFSKTLVGVMIDFSQVVMLTFVNGFQAAAGGNFVNALKLNKVLELSDKTLKENTANGKQTQDLASLFGASLLGLGMMVISASVILVLTVYIIFRIVGLWILLILSPMAFFALALPGKLQKGLDTFTNKWWQRLSAMLVGGPVVAFFLWLSLATVQGADPKTGPFGDIYPEDTTTASTAVSISAAGEPAQLSSFVVSVIMLLAGLEAAISSTQSISQEGWQRVKQAKGIATRLTARAAKAGVRASVGAGAYGVRAIDQRVGLSAGLGKSISALGEKAAARGGLIGGALAPSLSRAGAAVSGISGARVEKAKGETEKAIKGLSAGEKNAYLRSMVAGAKASGNSEKLGMYEEMLQKNEISKAGQGIMKTQYENEWYKARGIDPNAANADQKKAAKAVAEGRMQREVANRMDALEKKYKARGDTDAVDKLGTDRDKNPALNNDLKDMKARMESKNNFKKLMQDTSPKALTDAATAVGIAQTAGWIDRAGNLMDIDEIKETDEWKTLASSPERAHTMESNFAHWGTQDGGMAMRALQGEMNGTPLAGAAPASEYRYRLDPNGNAHSLVNGAVVAAPVAGAAMTNFAQLTSNLGAGAAPLRAALTAAGVANPDAFAANFTGPLNAQGAAGIQSAARVYGPAPTPADYTPAARAGMADAQTNGVNSTAAFNIQPNGQYRTLEDQVSHRDAMASAMTNVTSPDVNTQRNGVAFMANMDPKTGSRGGQSREELVNALTGRINSLAAAMGNARAADRRNTVKVLKGLYDEANKALTKTTALSAEERDLVTLKSELDSGPLGAQMRRRA